MDYIGEQEIYIDLIFHPLVCLGPNERIGIWFQGCTIGCKDCIAKHTWEQTVDKKMGIKTLVEKVTSYKSRRLTISGGEPFDQPEALLVFLQRVRNDFDDILIYSGYEYEYLRKHFLNILEVVDVLVDGKFMKNLESNKAYKGSKNQRMYIFTPNLIPLYENYIKISKDTLQIHTTQNDIYVLGIPRIDDAKNIQKILNGEQ